MGDEQILQDILEELILQTRLDLGRIKDSFKAGDSSSIFGGLPSTCKPTWAD